MMNDFSTEEQSVSTVTLSSVDLWILNSIRVLIVVDKSDKNSSMFYSIPGVV